jgi:hypothetical protein
LRDWRALLLALAPVAIALPGSRTCEGLFCIPLYAVMVLAAFLEAAGIAIGIVAASLLGRGGRAWMLG